MIKETEELCERCGYPVHPCLPCEEVIALNNDFEEDDFLPPLPIPRSKINDLKYGKDEHQKIENTDSIMTPSLKGWIIPVLDKGYVRLIDWMGSDNRICEAARISYKSPSKGAVQDKKLLFYLYRNRHTSPFEQCNITFDIKLPLFVQGQMVRHRTARQNQISARYTELPNEFYIPAKWRKQDTKNKQGSVVEENWDSKAYYREICSKNQDLSADLENHCIASYDLYQEMLKDNVAREMARMVLPQNFYTEIYTNWDLHNLMHFFTLRLDEHAQFEIREYAKAMFKITERLYPWTIEAFNKYKFKIFETK